MSMNFMGLGFSFGSKGSGRVAKATQAVTGMIGKAMNFMSGLGKYSQSTATIIGATLGGAVGLAVTGFKSLGANASKAFSIVTGGIALVQAGLGSVLGLLSSINNLGPNLVKTFSGWFNGMRETLGTLAFGGMNLTTSLEAEAEQTGVSIRALGANMGFTGKALEDFIAKATEMSISLKAGGDESAKALRGWIEAEKELRALGLKSAEEFLRFNRAYGTQADTLRDSSRAMREEMGLSDKAISNIMGSLAELGKQTGDVGGAVNDINKLIPLMSRNLALAGGEMPEKEMMHFATAITSAGRAFFKTGESSDQARDFAFTLGQTMLEAREKLGNMFAGTEQEISQFSTELAVMTGNINKSFDYANAGPAEFMTQMADMVQATRKASKSPEQLAKGMNFLRGRFESALGTEMSAKLINFFGKMDSATLQSMGIVRDATADFGKMAREADRTGRTMQESFDFAKEKMFNAFRALGKPAARAWLKRVNAGMDDFKKRIATLAEDDGLLGKMAKKMSEVSQVGAQALLPDALQPIVTIMGTFSESLGPTFEMMEKLGVEFTSFTGILKGATLGLGLWAAQAKSTQKEGESFGDAMVRVGKEWIDSSKEMIKTATDWLAEIAKAFAEFDWVGLFGGETRKSQAKEGIGQLLAYAQEKFKDIDWKSIADNIGQGFRNLWYAIATDSNKKFVSDKLDELGVWLKKKLNDMVSQIDWGPIFKDVFVGAIKAAFYDIPKALLYDMPKAIHGVMMDALNFTGHRDVETGKIIDKDQAGFKKQKKIEDMFYLPVERVQTQSKQISQCLTDVHDKADYLFSNSINSFIEKDMEKSADVTELNSQKMIGSLQSISDMGQDIFAGMWHGIEMETRDAVDKIAEVARGLVSHLEQIVTMKSIIADTGSTDLSRFATPAASEERDRAIRELRGDQAVHEPMWYAGTGGYKDLFVARMDQLIAAVEGISYQVPSPVVQTAGAPPPRPLSTAVGSSKIPARTKAGGMTR